MYRLKNRHNLRISNTLAVIAALLLVITTLAGLNRPAPTESAVAQTDAGAVQQADQSDVNSKGHKMSLFLFRHR